MNKEIKGYIVKVGSMYVSRAVWGPKSVVSMELTSAKEEAWEIGFKGAMKVANAINGKAFALKMKEVADSEEEEKE